MSKRIKWTDLVTKIPHKVQVNTDRYFEIVWSDHLSQASVMGETRFEPDQIAIKIGQSNKEAVKTYLHELIHAVSDEYDVGLTETQVIQLEKAISTILKPGNVFKGKN